MPRKSFPVDNKGRHSKGYEDSYLKLPHRIINHPNFRNLNGSSIKVLIALCSKHNGFNNGRIFYSTLDIAKDFKMSKTTVARALEELKYYGFITLKKPGAFLGRKAQEWEITFLKSEGYNATNEWKYEKKPLNPRPKKDKNIIEQTIEDIHEIKQSRVLK